MLRCAMPGSNGVPDYRTPSPDAGHEAIRAPLAQAIDDLRDASVGVDDAYFLTDLLFSLVDTLLADVAALTARLAVLEPAVFTPEP